VGDGGFCGWEVRGWERIVDKVVAGGIPWVRSWPRMERCGLAVPLLLLESEVGIG
jgi:hypothetical protein